MARKIAKKKSSPRKTPLVGLIMGSQSDWSTMRHAAETLTALGVPHEARIVSAHRTPKRMMSYASAAKGRGLKVIIAGAGGAAHLPGMTASILRRELMDKMTRVPGYVPGFLQPIENRILTVAMHQVDRLLLRIFKRWLALIRRQSIDDVAEAVVIAPHAGAELLRALLQRFEAAVEMAEEGLIDRRTAVMRVANSRPRSTAPNSRSITAGRTRASSASA